MERSFIADPARADGGHWASPIRRPATSSGHLIVQQGAAARPRKPIVFIEATKTNLEADAPSWKHRYASAVWINPIVKHAYPVIGHLNVNNIRPEHVAAS